MKVKLMSYSYENTFIHRLSGLTKLVCFLLLTFAAMLTYDVRLLLAILFFSLWVFKIAKISFKQVKLLFVYLFVLMAANAILSYVFDPDLGVEIYGSSHELFRFNDFYIMTLEQIFYQVSKIIKYTCVVPLGLIFFCTTNPSEFASSLNRAKVHYKGSFAVSLTLRYFPDIQREFTEISQAQQARGLDMSHKEGVVTRLKNMLMVLSPLIFSTLDRVDLIGNAMDLRGFGKHKTRTWYTSKSQTKEDGLAMVVCSIFLVLAIVLIFVNGSRFYNPFINQ